ncbi:hypothetical protein M422DRAFT_27603, partial [Sphaerobolus stellatus SS14]
NRIRRNPSRPSARGRLEVSIQGHAGTCAANRLCFVEEGTAHVLWISKNMTVDHHRGYNCCRSTTLAARWQDTAPVTPTTAQIILASFRQP